MISEIGVALAAGIAAGSVAMSFRARARLRSYEPPHAAVLARRIASGIDGDVAHEYLLSELDSQKRSATRDMSLLALRARLPARMALSAGTGSAVLVLASGLSGSFERALALALTCFCLGALGMLISARLGRAASDDYCRFREQWNRRCGEAAELLRARPRAEWTEAHGAR